MMNDYYTRKQRKADAEFECFFEVCQNLLCIGFLCWFCLAVVKNW